MSKHLKPNDWIDLFKIYESSNPKNVWIEFAKYREITSSSKQWFKQVYKKFLYHNRDMNVLISMTGKSSKKSSNIGRPKNSGNKLEYLKELVEEIGYDNFLDIINDLVDDGDEKLIDKLKEITKKTRLSSRKTGVILNVSSKTICNIRNNKYHQSKHEPVNEKLIKWIYDIYIEFNGHYGRKPISQEILKRYGYVISDRQVGRIMNKIGLFCQIRRPKRAREQKNTNVKVDNIVQRDFDNKYHTEEILATDVTYIEGTYDALQNHVYLSVFMHHKTKEVLEAKLSMYNDTKLVNDSFISMKYKPKNAIIHSDHGSCYSSLTFTQMIKQHNWKQSMSRVGNSLDNRVVEFWFSILKTELIYNLNIKKMSFKELENEIANFIDYYNNVRIQEKLNWMAPSQYRKYLYNQSTQNLISA